MRFEEIKARLEACERTSPPDRDVFLKAACGEDVHLRRRAATLYDQRFGTPEAKSFAARRIGPYQLEREIGRGGMGVVYLASRADEQYERRVAIKLMSANPEGGELLERFLNERQILAHLDHPNICRMFDGGMTEDGEPYLVMEYVRGAMPIDEYCNHHKLTVKQRVELFKSVCRAVAYAHRLLIVHRDLKPDNILVAGDGVVKLMDFGLAKNLFAPVAVKRAASRTMGFQAMTPAYASPEQVRGEPIGTATDIYSLGVILYELLTGSHPFDADDSLSVRGLLESIVSDDPEPPSERVKRQSSSLVAEHRHETTPAGLTKSLRGDLDSIVLTAIQKDADRRYGSVERFEDDLRRYLMAYPVASRPDDWTYRASKYVRRHSAALAAATLFVLLIAGFGVTTAIQAQKIAQERDAAQQVAKFLEGLFQNPDPEKSSNMVTAREILDQGYERVTTSELTSHPELQAQLIATMGQVYHNLGISDRAVDLWQRSLELRRKQFGPDSLEAADSAVGLARTLNERSEYARAEEMARESLRIRLKLLGENREPVAESLSMVGLLLQARGKWQEAEASYLRALKILEGRNQTESPEYAIVSSNLGGLYSARAQWPQAEARFRAVLAYRLKTLGPEHPRVAMSMDRLAQVLNAEGRYQESERLFRQAISIQEKHLAADHPRLTQTYNNLASLMQDKGDFEAAEALYRKSLDLGIRRKGESHTDTAVTYNNLGTLQEEMNRMQEARASLERSLAIRRKIYGDAHVSVARTLNNLARVIARQGDVVKGEQMCLDALRIRQKLLAPDHPDLASSWWTLGKIAEIKRDWAAAVEWHTRAVTLRRKVLYRQNLNTTESMLALGRLYLRQGFVQEAEGLIREAIGIRQEVLPSDNWRIAEARSLEGALLAAQNRFAEAEKLLTESDAILRKRPQTMEIREALERLPALRQQAKRLSAR